jgi:anti-sigma-K factor RskA
MDRETLLQLIPAYALDALDADERAAVEAQLVGDSEAQALLAEYQQLSAALVLAVPARPAPAHLNADLRQRLAARRPAVTPKPIRRNIQARWLAAAAALLALILGGVWLLSQGMLPVAPDPTLQGESLYQQIAQAAETFRLPVTPSTDFASAGITGELVADTLTNLAVIRVTNLPPLGADQTYQLWLAGPELTVSGGLFRGTDGLAYIALPLEYPLNAYRGFGVSLEQAGGSPDPNRRTGPSVFGVRLADA